MSKLNSLISIQNISSYVIVSEVAFVLSNIGLPFSSKPQQLSIYTLTQSGYIRDYTQYKYSSTVGQLVNPTFTCLNTQIGYTTSCDVKIELYSQIMGDSYIELYFPSGFKIANAFSQCSTTGPSINAMSNCNGYAVSNSISVSALADASVNIAKGSVIVINLASL